MRGRGGSGANRYRLDVSNTKSRKGTMNYSATYSPEDNKLRLYATSRLDAETYSIVKAEAVENA